MIKSLPAWAPVVALTLALGACSGEPRIDTTSAYALNNSVADVSAELPPEERQRFQAAVATLVDASDANGLESLAAALGPQIGGKTAAEVIAIADAVTAVEAKRAAEEQRQRKLAELDRKISEYTAEIARLEAVVARQTVRMKGLRDFSFSDERYFWRDSLAESFPLIDVRITNEHDKTIETVTIRGLLKAGGSSATLVDGQLRYEFQGGLKPGQSQKMRFEPDVFGQWAKADLQKRKDLQLSVELVNVSYKDGSELVSTYVIPGDDPAFKLKSARRKLEKAKSEHAALVKEIRSASL